MVENKENIDATIGLDLSLLGERIQAKREADRLALREAAQQCGVSYSTLSRLERGVAYPDVETLNRILSWLGLQFSRVVKGSEPVRAHLRAQKNLTPRVATALADVARRSQLSFKVADAPAPWDGWGHESIRPDRAMRASVREVWAVRFRKAIGCTQHEALDPFTLDITGVQTVYLSDIPGVPEDIQDILIGRFKSHWSAMTLPTNDRESAWLIVLNPTHAIERQRATLMEELCHILLGHQLTTLSHVEGQTFRDYDDHQEKDAYGLGTAILVPRNPLVRRVELGHTLGDIANHFRVSEALIEYRIKVTGAWYQYKLRQHVRSKS
jgi:transcriptional regulator with XRE-family HTH domain